MLVRVTCLASFTLRPHLVCVFLQVKEEDEDAAEGGEENTMVVHICLNFHHQSFNHSFGS